MDAKYGCNWGGWFSIDPPGRMGWGSGSILERGGGFFQVISDSNQVMGPISNFEMMCSVDLKDAFLVLYNIARVKDVLVAVNMDFSSGSLQWNVSFIRLVHN